MIADPPPRRFVLGKETTATGAVVEPLPPPPRRFVLGGRTMMGKLTTVVPTPGSEMGRVTKVDDPPPGRETDVGALTAGVDPPPTRVLGMGTLMTVVPPPGRGTEMATVTDAAAPPPRLVFGGGIFPFDERPTVRTVDDCSGVMAVLRFVDIPGSGLMPKLELGGVKSGMFAGVVGLKETKLDTLGGKPGGGREEKMGSVTVWMGTEVGVVPKRIEESCERRPDVEVVEVDTETPICPEAPTCPEAPAAKDGRRNKLLKGSIGRDALTSLVRGKAITDCDVVETLVAKEETLDELVVAVEVLREDCDELVVAVEVL